MLKILQSSQNPATLSLTVKGILVGLVPLALLLFGGNITEGDANEVINGVIGVITAVSGAVAAIITVLGAVRKVKNKLKK